MNAPAVLIIDDVKSIVDEFTLLLGLLDINAVGASSIRDGIEILASNPSIRVVITDVRLSGESGFDLVPKASGHDLLRDRKITYFFMSGEMQLTMGQEDYCVLRKPVNIPSLINDIRSALERGEAAK